MAFVPMLRKIRRQSKKFIIFSAILTTFIITYLSVPNSLQTNNDMIAYHDSRHSVSLLSDSTKRIARTTRNSLEWDFGMKLRQDELSNGDKRFLKTIIPEHIATQTTDKVQKKDQFENKIDAAKKEIVMKVEQQLAKQTVMTGNHDDSDDDRGGVKSIEDKGHLEDVDVPDLQNDVFDPENLKIMPKRPIVPEGHILQLTCAVASLLSHAKPQDVPHVTFELPPKLNSTLRGKINMIVRPGVASLRFSSVRRGHQGTYKCKAIDDRGKVTYNTVDVGVIKNDNFDEDKNSMWIKRNMYGEPNLSDKRNSVVLDVLKKKKRRKPLPREPEPDLETIRNVLGSKEDLANVNITKLLERGKFQEQQVEKFCYRFQLDHIKLKLPQSNQSTFGLYRHLLLNELSETLFCFMPKVGCTNLRVLFFVVQGFIPLSQLLKDRDAVDQNRLESAQYAQSFMNRNDIQRSYALRRYFKFIMYRNPLERLISGYRSKVQRFPLQGLRDNEPHYNFLRKEILLWTNVTKYTEFMHQRGKMAINISFSAFIDYWVRQQDTVRYNEHFRSIFKISQPCRVRYNFYGNFKNFETDAQVLVNRIGGKPEYIRSGYYGDAESTERLTPSYYAQLTDAQKKSVLKILAVDLEFYYYIFPEERDAHKTIMGIDDDLELPEAITVHYKSPADSQDKEM